MRDFGESFSDNIHLTKVRSFCMKSKTVEDFQIEEAESIAQLINKIEQETSKSIVSIELSRETNCYRCDLYIPSKITFASL
jgi:hypothetical protein